MAEYIEREAYAAELAKGVIITDDLYGIGIMSGLNYAMKTLKAQPAADVAPVVHGEWLDCENHNDIEQCSVCGMIYRYPTFYRYNYCPNCGADMRGSSDG